MALTKQEICDSLEVTPGELDVALEYCRVRARQLAMAALLEQVRAYDQQLTDAETAQIQPIIDARGRRSNVVAGLADLASQADNGAIVDVPAWADVQKQLNG